MSKKFGLWLLFATPTWADSPRDPFQQPLQAQCAAQATPFAGWQLKGTIGIPTRRHAWVVTPQGQWLMLQPQQRLLDEHWQVVQIQTRQLALRSIGTKSECSPASSNILLSLGTL